MLCGKRSVRDISQFTKDRCFQIKCGVRFELFPLWELILVSFQDWDFYRRVILRASLDIFKTVCDTECLYEPSPLRGDRQRFSVGRAT